MNKGELNVEHQVKYKYFRSGLKRSNLVKVFIYFPPLNAGTDRETP